MHNGKRTVFWCNPQAGYYRKVNGRYGWKEIYIPCTSGTKVKSVNTMNLDGKTKRRGMTFGKTAKTKKAIVTLTEDSKDIEIFEGL